MEFAKDLTIFDLKNLPIEVQGHVPYVVILLQAGESWKEQNDGKLPKSFADKQAFKDGIKAMAQDYGK